MVLLEGKPDFQMGSPRDEPGRKNNEDQHIVDVRPFEIATTEVTITQFRPFLEQVKGPHRTLPGSRQLEARLPQTHVIWFEAAHYCNWRSEQEGIPIEQWCYKPNADGRYAPGMKIAADFLSRTGYRLPTEAEWEYACRAGTVTSRCIRRLGRADRALCVLSAQPTGFAPSRPGRSSRMLSVSSTCTAIYSSGARTATSRKGDVDDDGWEIVDDQARTSGSWRWVLHPPESRSVRGALQRPTRPAQRRGRISPGSEPAPARRPLTRPGSARRRCGRSFRRTGFKGKCHSRVRAI